MVVGAGGQHDGGGRTDPPRSPPLRQQVGICVIGGVCSVPFIVQAVLIVVLFFGFNYYLWLGIERIPGSERYRKFIPYLLVTLTVCVVIWMTPFEAAVP